MALERRMDVVSRLSRGNGGEYVMESEVGGSYGFGSEKICMEGVGSYEEESEVVGCLDLDFALGAIVCVEGEVEEVVTMVESVGMVEGVMRQPA